MRRARKRTSDKRAFRSGATTFPLHKTLTGRLPHLDVAEDVGSVCWLISGPASMPMGGRISEYGGDPCLEKQPIFACSSA